MPIIAFQQQGKKLQEFIDGVRLGIDGNPADDNSDVIRGAQNLDTGFDRLNLFHITAFDSADPNYEQAKSRTFEDRLWLDQGEGIGIRDGDDFNSANKKRIDGDEILQIQTASSDHPYLETVSLQLGRVQTFVGIGEEGANAYGYVDGGLVRVTASLNGSVVGEVDLVAGAGKPWVTPEFSSPFDSLQITAVPDSNTRFTFWGIEAVSTDSLPPSTIGGDFLVNDVTVGNQTAAWSIQLENGHYVIAWTSTDQTSADTSSSAIKARIFSENGDPVSDEFLVNEIVANGQYEPKLAALPGGGFVVSWSSSDTNDVRTNVYDTKARVFNADGTPAGAEFLVNQQTQDQQLVNSVAALSDGTILVTWANSRETDSAQDYGISARIFQTDGTALTDEFAVNQITNDLQYDPDVVELANGHLAFVWHSNDQIQDDRNKSIKAVITDKTGAVVVDEFLVNEIILHDQQKPDIQALSNGGFAVTWTSTDGGVAHETKARVFNADGTPSTSEFTVREILTGIQDEPRVTQLENDNLLFVWASTTPDTTTDIKARIFDVSGQPVTTEFLINETTENYQTLPSVTASRDGGFLVTWQSRDGVSGDDDLYGIFARFFDANGMPVEDQGSVTQTATPQSQDSFVFGDLQPDSVDQPLGPEASAEADMLLGQSGRAPEDPASLQDAFASGSISLAGDGDWI